MLPEAIAAFGVCILMPLAFVISRYLIREKEIQYGHGAGNARDANLELRVRDLENQLAIVNEKLNTAILKAEDDHDLRRSLETRG